MDGLFPTANLLGFNLWGRGLVTRSHARPEKPEQSWNLATFHCWVSWAKKSWKIRKWMM